LYDLDRALDRDLDVLDFGGLLAGYTLQGIFAKAGFGLASSPVQSFTGGCFLPTILGVLSGVGVARLLPGDPCGGAFTADAQFVPLLVVPLVTIGSIVMFWAKAWHR
jgi:hypothetical protein